MGVLSYLVALAAALAIHVVGAWIAPQLPRVLDLFLVVTVLNALSGSSPAGLLGGTAAGLTHDALSGRLYGLHGFADTIVGYAVARAAQRLDLAGPGAVFVTLALATLLEEATLVLLGILLTDPQSPEPVWVVVEALANGAVGTIAHVGATRAHAVRDRARKKRMSRIRL